VSEWITPGQALRLGAMAADALCGKKIANVQSIIEKGDEYAAGVVELVQRLSGQPPKLAIPIAPGNLTEMLKDQVSCLLRVNAHKQLGLTEEDYRGQLEAAVKAFQWRRDLAEIGLDKVALVDFRLSGKFLAEAGGVRYRSNPDRYRNYPGVVTPPDVLVIQGQWGSKYRNKTCRWCRENFDALEQGLTVIEGLTVFLHEGIAVLQNCYLDLPGSVPRHGGVPSLRLRGGRPVLDSYWDWGASGSSGSASRGK